MEEANKLIGTGKKHLVMGKVVEAVGALQEACGMLAKKYGDTADECGEAFFWCGKALLDLARMENSVLGNALEGVPEEEEEEEEEEEDDEDDEEKKPNYSKVDCTENLDEKTRDELRVQVYDAMAEKKNENTETVEGKSEEKKDDIEKAEAGDKHQKDEDKDGDVKGSKSDKSEDEMETEKKSADKEDAEEEEEEEEDGDNAEMEADAEEGGEGDAAAEKDSDDEEVGNLQLSWEMLEVAKVIYKRKEAKEDQLMAAQTHLKLGEVSSESGNYTQALEDFQECLKLQVKHLDSDSRLLAETHYQLGLTYSLDLQYSQAIEELKSSISVIKSRLDKLQQLLDKAEGPEALSDERKEIEELNALLPEIQEKVEDSTEGLKMTSTETAKGALDGGSTSSAFPGTTVQTGDSSSSSKINGTSTEGASSTIGHASPAPASDISHLVRKKHFFQRAIMDRIVSFERADLFQRKPEESPVKEEGVIKKVKQNDSPTKLVHKANGDTKSTDVKRK
ncbi:nuclear autoantigenic sperm protein-like isoform X2 [Cottoperca gobio]|uniref:Nuclear autoantigenic sperm protein-like isoform X2 n=1 Tax=Cottoperca gobio TaxID=56716 RepID=A0A6J2RJI4_COTGO|nr:nuclear autoantigenic sperm protein-like isoform X2 [Cottoperca gobio]